MLDKHPAVHKLCFVSETCIPILPLDAFCHILGRDNNSWVKYYNDVSTGYAFQKQVREGNEGRRERVCMFGCMFVCVYVCLFMTIFNGL